MFGIVVGEFCQGEEAGPVGLLVVHIHPHVLLHHRIHPLRLAIRPGMEGRRVVGLHPQEILQPPPEVRSENRVPITHECVRYSMDTHYVLDK